VFETGTVAPMSEANQDSEPRGVPAAGAIARAVVTLTNQWDNAIVERASSPVKGSQAAFDQQRLPEHGVDPRLAGMPAGIAFLSCASVIQVARSLAALFAVSEDWALTLGHLPLVRSILEGVGQVRWTILGAGPIDARVAVDEIEGERLARERVARACLLQATCLQQAQRDFKAQRDTDAARHAKEQLNEWRDLTRTAFRTLRIDRKRHNTWEIDGAEVPGFNDLADAGFDLSWWPSPSDGRSLYPWVSAASHHRLYPLIGQLVPSSVNGRPVGRISPDPLELTSGGLVGALAVLRMLDLVFAYLGWPSERLSEVAEDLSLVHKLVKGNDGTGSDDDETVGWRSRSSALHG
jgi:hypothetical protein